MKTELILENKLRFSAQYWGQQVMTNEVLDSIHILTYVTNVNIDKEEYYLLLKPLSSITDEDAIEVSNILGINNEAMVHHGRLFVDRILGKRAGNSQDNCYLTYTSLHCCDYLRSKGYALPYMGTSIDDLISAAWIKLKS